MLVMIILVVALGGIFVALQTADARAAQRASLRMASPAPSPLEAKQAVPATARYAAPMDVPATAKWQPAITRRPGA